MVHTTAQVIANKIAVTITPAANEAISKEYAAQAKEKNQLSIDDRPQRGHI